jgi:hypothetical protein
VDKVCDWFRGVLSASVDFVGFGRSSVDFGRFRSISVDFGSVFDLRRFWVPSGSKTALSGVVNPELQFEFEKKDKKEKKPRKIKGLKQKNKNQLGHLVTTSPLNF